MNRWLSSSKSLAVHAVTVVALAMFGSSPPALSTDAKLPDLSSFLTNPSDRFLVDIKELTGGHPFLGVDSPRPHAGGHVHFDNSDNLWPTGSACRFYYSIEPIAPEPSEGFYKKFILVSEGQKVRKADVIAYLYTPPKVGGWHIHFHDDRWQEGFLRTGDFHSRARQGIPPEVQWIPMVKRRQGDPTLHGLPHRGRGEPFRERGEGSAMTDRRRSV